jgi:catechol 2,3-dioxygenase-like lactoylglutathione lyase family enzyme
MMKAIHLWPVGLLLFFALAQCTSAEEKRQQTARLGRLVCLGYQSPRPDSSARFFRHFFGAIETSLPAADTTGVALGFRPEQPSVYFGPARGILPGPDLPPTYGVRWLALRTQLLDPALQELQTKGLVLESPRLFLPAERVSRAVAFQAPDRQQVVVVERRDDINLRGYALDHVQLLVADLRANVKFFKEVFGAEVMLKEDRGTVLYVGGTMLVLSEPEGLRLNPAEVAPFRPSQMGFGANRLIFHYDSLPAALAWAEQKGWGFYRADGPSGHAYLYSPDSIRCELIGKMPPTSLAQKP